MHRAEFTIDVLPTMTVCTPGKLVGSKLWFQAPGLDIYVCGQVKSAREYAVYADACNIALDLRIPLNQLKTVRGTRAPKTTKIDPKQGRLF